jgi:hypothetical protein
MQGQVAIGGSNSLPGSARKRHAAMENRGYSICQGIIIHLSAFHVNLACPFTTRVCELVIDTSDIDDASPSGVKSFRASIF